MDYSGLWDVRIFLDLLLGGIGVGIFLYAAFGLWGRGKDGLAALKVCAVSSLALVALGALCLVSELGRPLGIMSTVTGFNAQSPTSWGGVLQVAFLLVDAALCALLLARKDAVRASVAFKVLGALGVGLAALLLAYHGLVLNATGRGLWADALIVPLFMASSVLAGGAVAAAVARAAAGPSVGDAAFVAGASLTVAVLMLAFGFTVAPAGADALYCYRIMMAQSGALWWLVAFGAGAVVPLALAAAALARPALRGVPLAVAIAVCAVAGSVALKFLLTSTAQILIG